MSTREERAARRRQTWTGRVTTADEPRGRLYDELTPEQRLAAMTRLHQRAWQAAGLSLKRTSRRQWPGEVFEIRRRD